MRLEIFTYRLELVNSLIKFFFNLLYCSFYTFFISDIVFSWKNIYSVKLLDQLARDPINIANTFDLITKKLHAQDSFFIRLMNLDYFTAFTKQPSQ